MDIPGKLVQPPPAARPGSPEFEPRPTGIAAESGSENSAVMQEVQEHPSIPVDIGSIVQQHPSTIQAPQSDIDALAGKDTVIPAVRIQEEIHTMTKRPETESLRWRLLSYVRQLAQRLRWGKKTPFSQSSTI
ncbi:MAG: hypothetical protein Q8R11_03120 [bacterium]|nr:hypothetical protein [bacterium]